MKRLLIATRQSTLAMRQSRLMADAIRAQCPDVEVELASMTTRGDRHRGPLAAAGGKGLFTRELEQALRAGEVQLAVHSAKDLPSEMDEEFAIVAVPARADPRDALVGRRDGLAALPAGAAVGTGSPRRGAQLLALRGDLTVRPIRGNVDTRLNKALSGDGGLAAAVLAVAGLIRSGLADSHAEFINPLDSDDMIPAAGQGVLAVQALADNAEIAEMLEPLNDPPTRAALIAERRIVRELGADCHSCLAVFIAPERDGWCGRVMVAQPDGSDMIRLRRTAASADEVASALLVELSARDAAALLKRDDAGGA